VVSLRSGQFQRQDLRTIVRVDPSVVLRSKVLELTQQELENFVESELADNPALERIEEEFSAVSDELVLRAVAPQELKYTKEDAEFQRCRPSDDGERPDWVDLAATTNSLHDHVRAQLDQMVDGQDLPLAHYLVESLDPKGYLDSSVEEISLALNLPLERVQHVLHLLQQCEPIGIGARNVTECLLLQLRDADTLERKLARAILKDHMDELVARRTGRISRRFKVMPHVVEAAFQEILALNPNPAEDFSTTPNSLILSHTASVQPDLILSRNEQGWQIEPIGADPTLYRVSDSYKQRLERAKKARRIDKDEKAHLQEYTQRAEQFIQCLKDRRRTLRRIGEYLIERQLGFVSMGRYEFLTPLTRTQLAHDLGVHESTISRATMGKFVQIATGDIVSFEVFFKPALRIQKMIEEILSNENPASPLSDEAIARLLEAKGVNVARRTVNKYRDRTRLLNSRTRKSA
jgi:RNA polymerase sigma-54 factor